MNRLSLLSFVCLFAAACSGPSTEGPAARCGDTRVSASEECDDGNDVDDDACTNECKNAACGDGIVRLDLSEGMAGYEACDDGNAVDEDAQACDLREQLAATA